MQGSEWEWLVAVTLGCPQRYSGVPAGTGGGEEVVVAGFPSWVSNPHTAHVSWRRKWILLKTLHVPFHGVSESAWMLICCNPKRNYTMCYVLGKNPVDLKNKMRVTGGLMCWWLALFPTLWRLFPPVKNKTFVKHRKIEGKTVLRPSLPAPLAREPRSICRRPFCWCLQCSVFIVWRSNHRHVAADQSWKGPCPVKSSMSISESWDRFFV